MSFRVVAKVLRDSDEKLARRLILLVLAEAAHDDGVAWIDQETIAKKARLSRTHTTERIREMEADGVLEIRQAKRGRSRVNVYRVVLEGLDEVVYEKLPFTLDAPFSTTSEVPTPSIPDDVGSSGPTTSEVPSLALVPSLYALEPSGEPEEQRARAGRSSLGANLPKKVDRKPVLPAEGELAVAILDGWNLRAGQALSSGDWLAKIVMRIREYPDLDLADHAAIIEAALANPWWTGAATPSVVYGSGAQFERSVLSAKSGPKIEKAPPRRFGRGMTTREVLDRYGGGSNG